MPFFCSVFICDAMYSVRFRLLNFQFDAWPTAHTHTHTRSTIGRKTNTSPIELLLSTCNNFLHVNRLRASEIYDNLCELGETSPISDARSTWVCTQSIWKWFGRHCYNYFHFTLFWSIFNCHLTLLRPEAQFVDDFFNWTVLWSSWNHIHL